MKKEIKMPRLGTNDDVVTLAQWLVKNGESVEKNQAIAILETTKETSELYALETGYIYILKEEGTDVEVEENVAYISEKREELSVRETENSEKPDSRVYSDKALALIQKHNIDVSLLPKEGIIKEKDVLALISRPYYIGSTNKNQVLIYGGGGFCKAIIDILRQKGEYRIAGILERKYPNCDDIKGYKVIGTSDEKTMYELYQKGYTKVINAVGFDGKKHGRKAPYDMLKKIGFEFVNVVHPRAIIEPDVFFGEGNLIAAGAIIGSDAIIGNNCIINAGCIISHDCIISDNCHIASGAILGGNVIVGENTLIGQGCTIFKGIKIGDNVVIANGAKITRDVPSNSFVE